MGDLHLRNRLSPDARTRKPLGDHVARNLMCISVCSQDLPDPSGSEGFRQMRVSEQELGALHKGAVHETSKFLPV